MNYRQIATMPTSVTPEMWGRTSHSGIHESCTRAYQILSKVKTLLEAGTPVEVVSELIYLMESDDFKSIEAEAKGDSTEDKS